jgi:stalled ribosome rescue protein Dom34
MNPNKPKQYAGVWLDSQNAMVISNSTDEANGEYAIQDKVKAHEYHGGKGEHGSNKADQANSLKYYKSVAAVLSKYDEILIFGPGQAQEEFLNFLSGDSQFNSKKMTIDSSDQMTDPQMIARVRDFFNAHQS